MLSHGRIRISQKYLCFYAFSRTRAATTPSHGYQCVPLLPVHPMYIPNNTQVHTQQRLDTHTPSLPAPVLQGTATGRCASKVNHNYGAKGF